MLVDGKGRRDPSLARTKISNTIAEKQKIKPGVAGEAISCTASRVRERGGVARDGASAQGWELVFL